MPLLPNTSASDITLRLQARTRYANYIVQKQNVELGRTNRIEIESGSGKGNPSSAIVSLEVGARETTAAERDAILEANNPPTPPAPATDLLRSKDTITDDGFTIGGTVNKDMSNEDYTQEFDPQNYYPIFFPDMIDFTDSNIIAGDKDSGDRLIASYWNDLGNDVFDDWGYFYIYDVGSEKYYFPLISPQNEADGTFTTQTFNAFGRTFTIRHGWAVQGIFKFDITAADSLPFRFGAYGNMGSDGDEFTEDLTYNYTIGSNTLTLYYHHHAEDGDSNEVLYSYFVPKTVSENASQTYNAYYDSDDMSMISKVVTNGLIVYFAKKNDVKEWVANDIEIDA